MADEQFIVIVDDDGSIREAATSLFRSMGLATVAFPSAEEYLSSGFSIRPHAWSSTCRCLAWTA